MSKGSLPRRKFFKFPEKIAESASRTPRFLLKVEGNPPLDRAADIAEITKFMTQSAAIRRGRKLTKRTPETIFTDIVETGKKLKFKPRKAKKAKRK